MIKKPVSGKPSLPPSYHDIYRKLSQQRNSSSIHQNLRQERVKSGISNNQSSNNDQDFSIKRSNSSKSNNQVVTYQQQRQPLIDIYNIQIKLPSQYRKQNSYQMENKENIVINKIFSKREKISSGISEKQIDFNDFKQRLRFPPPKITAKSWCIFELNSCKMIWGQRCQKQREVASLTKIMTIMTAIKLCKLMKIDINQTYFKVSQTASCISGSYIIAIIVFSGTTANLKSNTWLKIHDLFYAILLPSGNDAAYTLAENLGGLYNIYSQFDVCGRLELLLNDRNKRADLSSLIYSITQPVNIFISEMNKLAKELNIYNSSWANPHGLSNKYNKSTAHDIGRLSCKAMQNELFKEIVKTKEYKAIIIDEDGLIYEQKWVNTNKLLDEGWEGIKTGITNPAGPCLSCCTSSTLCDSNQTFSFVIVLLGSQTMEHRWDESKTLLNWVCGKE